MKLKSLAIAALFALALPAAGECQSPPFNSGSIATLGGNCGGTGALPWQASGAITQCLAAGTNGFVLTLAAGVPTWATGSASGSISSGTAGQLAYYAGAGAVLSGFPNGTNGFVLTMVAGVPAWQAAGGGSQAANSFYAAPDGASGSPSFRAVVAADLPATIKPNTVQPVSGALLLSAPSATQLQLGRGGAIDWFIGGSNGAFIPVTDNTRDFGSNANRMRTAYIVNAGDATTPITNGYFTNLVNLSLNLDNGFSSVQGSVLYRGAGAWAALAPGAAGLPLVSNGAAANPSYQALSTANVNYTGPGTGGATISSTQKFYNNWVSAKDYANVSGGGTLDDAPGLQNAINQVCNAYPNNTLYVPAGSYKLNTGLVANCGIHIVGDGFNATTFAPAAGIVALSATTASPVIIEKIGIIYPTAQSAGLWAISIDASGGQTNTGSIIRDVLVSNAYNGISFQHSAFFTIDHSTVQIFPNVGIQVSNAVNADVGDSSITNSTIFASYVGGQGVAGINQLSSGGLRVTNNKLAALQYGLLFQLTSSTGDTAQLIMTSNSCDTISLACLYMVRATANSFNSVVFSSNVCAVNFSCFTIPTDGTGNWINMVTCQGNTWVGMNTAGATGFSFAAVGPVAVSCGGNTLFGNHATSVGMTSMAAKTNFFGNVANGTFATTYFNGGVGSISTGNI